MLKQTLETMQDITYCPRCVSERRSCACELKNPIRLLVLIHALLSLAFRPDLNPNAFIYTDAMLLWCVMGRIWGDVHHATSVWTFDHWNIIRNRILSCTAPQSLAKTLTCVLFLLVCSGFCRKCRHGYHAGSQCVTLDDVIAQKTARVKKTMVGFS